MTAGGGTLFRRRRRDLLTLFNKEGAEATAEVEDVLIVRPFRSPRWRHRHVVALPEEKEAGAADDEDEVSSCHWYIFKILILSPMWRKWASNGEDRPSR